MMIVRWHFNAEVSGAGTASAGLPGSAAAGPNGGAGGNMMTTFQVFTFDATGEKSRYCAGQWRKWNGEFQQRW